MTTNEFYKLVEEMRSAQKEYFKYRLNRDLIISKETEQRVDAEIRKAKKRQENAHTVNKICDNCRCGNPIDEHFDKCVISGETKQKQDHCANWIDG